MGRILQRRLRPVGRQQPRPRQLAPGLHRHRQNLVGHLPGHGHRVHPRLAPRPHNPDPTVEPRQHPPRHHTVLRVLRPHRSCPFIWAKAQYPLFFGELRPEQRSGQPGRDARRSEGCPMTPRSPATRDCRRPVRNDSAESSGRFAAVVLPLFTGPYRTPRRYPPSSAARGSACAVSL